MRLQKVRKTSSHMVVMIFLTSLIIGYGVFRLLDFKPILLLDDTAKRLLGKMSTSITSTTKKAKKDFLSFFHAPMLQQEMDRLLYENRLYKVQLALNQNYAEENISLKKLLGLLTLKDYALTPCDIWFRDIDNPMNFTINKGKADKLTMEQGIVYPLELKQPSLPQFQLVGRIKEINQHSSRVLSILDPLSRISCRNVRTRALGTIQYDKEKNVLYLLAPSESDEYAVQDVIVTSDLSSLPKNLIIGIVQRIEPSTSVNKRVILGTTLDFLQLTSVVGIK